MTALGVGESKTIAKNYTFNSAGIFYIGACANKVNSSNLVNPLAVPESNEDNNCGPWTKITVSSVPLSDLIAIAPNPTIATSGVSTNLSSIIENQGELSTVTSFSNFFQVSTRNPNDVSPNVPVNTYITDLAAVSMQALAVGASAITTQSYDFKTVGTYYVRACADQVGFNNQNDPLSIVESNEDNNCGVWTGIVIH